MIQPLENEHLLHVSLIAYYIYSITGILLLANTLYLHTRESVDFSGPWFLHL